MTTPNVDLPSIPLDYTQQVVDRVNKNNHSTPTSKGKWQPAQWRNKYDMVIALSVQGHSEYDIAARFKLTARRVQQILACDAAQAIMKGIRMRMFDAVATTIPQRVSILENSAISNMEKVLNDSVLLETSPLGIYDRSKSLLESTGKIPTINKVTGGTNNTQVNVTVVPVENAKTFIAGINKVEQYEAQKALPSGPAEPEAV